MRHADMSFMQVKLPGSAILLATVRRSWIGITLTGVGMFIMAWWIIGPGRSVALSPRDVAPVVSTGLAFFLTGLAQMLAVAPPPAAQRSSGMLGAALIALGAAMMLQNLTNGALGIDLPGLHGGLGAGSARPGRMSPDTALAFALSGFVLLRLRQVGSKSSAIQVQLAMFMVLMLGLTGLVGSSVELEYLYPWYRAGRMSFWTANAMTLSGIGLWQLCRRQSWSVDQALMRDDERTGLIGAAILAMAVTTTGVAGFSAQQKALEASLVERLPAALDNHRRLFSLMTEHALAAAHQTAMQPAILEVLHSGGASLPAIAGVADAALDAGRRLLSPPFTALRVVDASGRTLLGAGEFAHEPPLMAALDAEQTTMLLWKEGFQLRTRIAVQSPDGRSGVVLLEQALPAMTRLFAGIDGFGPSGEMGLCAAQAHRLACIPQRRNPQVYYTPRIQPDGRRGAMSKAVDGLSGTFKGRDYRGNNVISAYLPLATRGLGLVIKEDTDDLFAPIRDQLHWGLPMLLLLVVAAVILLRSQVRPLIMRLSRSEQEARDRQAQIRAVVENVGEGILTLTEDGRIESFNQAASSMFGHSSGAVFGMPIWNLIRPAEHADLRQLPGTVNGVAFLTAGSKRELKGFSADGYDFDVEVSTTVMRVQSRQSLVCIVRDITDRKRVEQRLLHAKELAESAARVKGQFLANMSHEVRTPMNGVIGMTNLLLKTPISAQQKDYLDLINSSAHSLLRLLNDVLDFSKIEAQLMALDPQPLVLRELLHETIGPFIPRAAEKGVALRIEVADAIPQFVVGDRLRLSQILTNLTDNALKFTVTGSIVWRIKIVPVTTAPPPIAASADVTTVQIQFSVTDTGIGIAASNQQRIFDAFTQADTSTTRKFGGTGLGLSIVSQLVTLMGGTLGLVSELGAGACFTIALDFPVASALQESPTPLNANNAIDGSAPLPAVAQSNASRRLHVLVAEDNPVNQRLLTSILDSRGHTHALATSGREVLALLDAQLAGQSAAQPFGLVLMDCQMPELDGFDTTREIRQREAALNTHLRIIALTANASPQDRLRCLEAGMDDFVSKPIDVEQLMALVESRPFRFAHDLDALTTRLPLVPTALDCFDLDHALQNTGSKLPLLHALSVVFIDAMPLALDAIREAIVAEDTAALAQAAHQLKDSANTIGAHAVAHSAHALEQMGRQQALEEAMPCFGELVGQAVEVVDRLSAWSAAQDPNAA